MQSRLSNNSPSDPSPQDNPNQEREHEIISRFSLDDMPQPELAGHAWRQRGTELICESCPFTHASYIPPDKQLYGIDEKGYPMIRTITFQS